MILFLLCVESAQQEDIAKLMEFINVISVGMYGKENEDEG